MPLHEWKGFVSKDALSENLITWIFEEDSFSPIAKVKGNKYYSILADHLGTPIEMYQDDGSLFWERQLNANGKTIKETQQGSCPFLFQGQYYDAEIELAYNRFRYYDVEDGRYISQDPIGLLSGEFGFYNYVEDINQLIDPFGLAHLNALSSKANFKLYIIYEDANKTKVLKIGKAKDVNQVKSGRNSRMVASERKAKKTYPNAFAEEYRNLGYTSTRKAVGAEAKEVRKRRNKGELLPLNQEKNKSYKKNS